MDYPNSQYYAYKYFRPRWQKTQITFFASCVKSGGVTDHEQKGNTILTAQMITSHENLTSGSFSNTSESSSISEMASFSSSFDETDDVFSTTQHRRSSEPLKSALMGRSNKLRSQSEEIKEKFHQHRKLTKSASSPASSGSVSNSSQRRSSSHSQLNFLPQVVKKISLRTSLQDWLESEKQSREFGKTTFTRHSRASDSSVVMKKQLKFTRRSKSLSPEPIAWEGRDCNKYLAVAKHVYRRFSADSADHSYHSESSGRRAPAPQSSSCKKDDGGSHGNCKNTISEEAITTSPNIRRSSLVACCNTDVKYDNDQDFHIQCVMKEELRSRLGSLTFCAETCRDWCEEISEVIKEKVQLLNTSPCKVVCTIYIGALRDCGIHTATQALLDYKLDNHASACYQNNSLFAMASVFAVRYNCK